MSESQIAIEQNLIDAGCDKEFITKFMSLPETKNSERLSMLAAHRKNLLDDIHIGERKVYCLDYLVDKLKKDS